MITAGKIGIVSNIDLKSVSNMEISVKPNQHIKMVLSGSLDGSVNSLNSEWTKQDIQVVELGEDNCPKEVLFCGLIDQTYIYVENGVAQIIMTAVSTSVLLDKEKKSRSYQDVEKTYEQLVKKTVEDIGGNVEIYSSTTKQIQKPMIQYEETDWEFCKRMASHMGLPVYCKPSRHEVALQIGVNIGKIPVMKIGQAYQVFVKSDKSLTQEGPTYEVKSYDNFRIGDLISSPAGKMYIYEKTLIYENGELQYVYKLCYLKDIRVDVIYNPKIAGMMLEGEVVNTKGEKVFVKFDIDECKGEALYPYSWTPITGNIMYCMPECGTKIGVYFRCSDEREACAIVNLRRQEKYTVSTKRILESKCGKKIQMFSGQLAFRTEQTSGKQMVLELVDDGSISLQSNNCLSMYSSGNINLNAPYITVKTPTELHATCTSLSDMKEKKKVSNFRNPATGGGNVDKIFTMGQEFNLLSEQGVLCGTEHIQYEDCADALTEIPLSKFSLGKLVGNVLAGLVIVAAVAAVTAYTASVVFSGGAMALAEPFIVGGIAAIIGTATVLAKASSDYNNQTNSSVLDYIGAAFLGTTAGAVAGFSIAAVPYTAQMLTQQALLMLPGALTNTLTVSLISGGSMFVTGGIAFSNLIFTHYNVIEAVAGENPLKDWMIECDETYGESTYNILSGVSFLASMGIMFMGVNYMGSLLQMEKDGVNFAIVRGGKPLQWHHYFTNKNKTYTPLFVQIFQKYGLSLSDMWNKNLLPHLGRHPNEYHEFMLKQLVKYDTIAQGDINIFMQLIEELKKYIISHPEILYKTYWR